MKIAFYDTKPYDKESFDKYKEKYDVSFKYFETKLNEDTTELAKGFDGVCIFVNDTVNTNVIDALYNMGVKQVYLRCSGFNNIDMKYAKDKLHIMRVPAYSPYAVAEHAIALLLTLVRRTHKGYIRSRDFNFSLNGLTGFDLYNKTVGVIGTGKIGEVFINICRGFGMKVLAFDKYPKKDLENGDTIRYVDMDTLLKSSDIISLHCPLTDETQYIINEKSLKNIKKGVIIINTSRGALVDTEALLNGIKSRKIGGACLDVYEEESDVFFEDNSGHIMDDDILARLISMPNVILTSHQAFLTEEALQNIAITTLENITAFSKTGSCANEISYKKGLI